MGKKKNKLLVLGLDGVTFKVLLPIIQKGKLPTFKRLLRQSAYGELQGITPPITPPSWETAVTGVNPGKHNIFDFFYYTPDYDVEVLTSKDRAAPAVWDYAGKAGLKSIIFNYPMGYPPPKINGIFVSGMNTPGTNTTFTYPKEIKKEILSIVPDYQVDVVGDHLVHGNREVFFDECKKITRNHYLAFSYLLKNYDWDLAMLFQTMPDRVHHYFFHEDSYLIEYYQILDNILSDIQNRYFKDQLIIFSDHGMSRVSKDVFIESYLKEWKYLEVNNKADLSVKCSTLFNQIMRLLRKVGYRLGLANWAIRFLPERIFNFIVQSSDEPSSSEEINWQKTKVYFPTPSSQGLRVNLSGRENKGSIKVSGYNKLREEVINRLLVLRDPSNNDRIIKRVYKREEIYNGPYVENAQDLIIEAENKYHLQKGIKKNKIATATEGGVHKTAEHSKDAIFILCSDLVRKEKIKEIKLADVAAYILYTLDIEIPEEIEGQVNKNLFLK